MFRKQLIVRYPPIFQSFCHWPGSEYTIFYVFPCFSIIFHPFSAYFFFFFRFFPLSGWLHFSFLLDPTRKARACALKKNFWIVGYSLWLQNFILLMFIWVPQTLTPLPPWFPSFGLWSLRQVNLMLTFFYYFEMKNYFLVSILRNTSYTARIFVPPTIEKLSFYIDYYLNGDGSLT